MDFHNAIGLMGSGLIVVAYWMLQTDRLSSDNLAYSLLNLVGAGGIIFSLWFEPNLPSFVIESFWVLISFIGIYRWMQSRNRHPDTDRS